MDTNHQPHTNGDQLATDEIEAAQRLYRDPEALRALIDALPDPRAVVVLKALAPVLVRRMHRLARLEGWNRQSSVGVEAP